VTAAVASPGTLVVLMLEVHGKDGHRFQPGTLMKVTAKVGSGYVLAPARSGSGWPASYGTASPVSGACFRWASKDDLALNAMGLREDAR
jgi:hypothetical protein